MIKTIKYLLLFSPILFTSFECSDGITNPPEYSEGYQYDIPWPSLADSPWPMYRGNPQSTGRSKENLNLQGVVEWGYINQYGQLNSSIVIDKDSNIYVPYYYGDSWGSLNIIGFDGKLKYKLDTNYIPAGSTPIIASDGSFYNWTMGSGLTCYNPDKTVRWIYLININNYQTSTTTLGIDGTIYFMYNKSLYAIGKNGQLKWSVQDERFTSWQSAVITFSPDGKTLYIPGESNKAAIYALDITNRSIKWSFGQGKSYWSVVDSYGNLYVSTSVDSINAGKLGLFSVTAKGHTRWYYPHNQLVFGPDLSALYQPTIDKHGNIFFASDSIYSIDYSGNLRWKKAYAPMSNLTPFTCDNLGNVYISYMFTGNEYHLMKLNNKGETVFDITLNKDPGASMAIGNNRLYVPSGKKDIFYSIK